MVNCAPGFSIKIWVYDTKTEINVKGGRKGGRAPRTEWVIANILLIARSSGLIARNEQRHHVSAADVSIDCDVLTGVDYYVWSRVVPSLIHALTGGC